MVLLYAYVYAYVHNRPESSKDPFGLDTIVGVTPPTRTNPRRCVIWRKDYGQQRCYKRCKGDDRLLPTTCPDHPDDDPDGPSYQTGIDGLARGSRMLRELCDNCAAASGCSVAECKEEVNDIIFRLIAAWQNNYGKGCHNDPESTHPVGGHLCWDWSTIFSDALRPQKYKCFKQREWAAIPKEGTLVHYFTLIHCGGVKKLSCTVIFDDGFFTGTTANAPEHFFRNHPLWDYSPPSECPPKYPDCPHVPIGF